MVCTVSGGFIPTSAFNTHAAGPDGGPSGPTVTLVAAGTCTIAANQAGNNAYSAAPQFTQSFEVNKASQTITFAALANKTVGDPAFGLSATATSDLAVTFSSTTPAVCTIVSLNGTVNAQNSISTAYFQYTTVAGDYTGAIDITTTPAVASGRLATNVGVTLNNLDPNKTYYYRLVAQNAAGRVSGIERSFTTTAMPPVVASWSTIVRIAAKASTTLQVAAGGSGPMNYQWYKGQSGDTSTAIPGATGSSYTTPALVQATSYWVRVSNAGGSSDSPTVVVSVTYTTFLPLATQAASRAGAPGQPAESPRRQG